ncbi:hypothetical protein BSKO_06998 [Bryopsis sp. KO-2023]|nr:hypothetical protein BSKO_06998 [Bryopsis sp. KO-2023]
MLNFMKRKKVTKAKLGGENNFYFNEDLGRWVERGKEDEAEQEAAPAAPPTVDNPVEQRVMSGAGPASKYVDTGFGKPNATASSPKVPVFAGVASAKAPPPGVSFFVPQAPAEPESPGEGIGLIEDHELTHSGSGGSASPDVPRSNSNEAWSGQDSVKMGDPLSDFYGKSAEDQTQDEGVGVKDVFGVETDDEGSNGQAADPLDNIFGPPAQDSEVLDPEGGAGSVMNAGFTENVNTAGTEPPTLSLDDVPHAATENGLAGLPELSGNHVDPLYGASALGDGEAQTAVDEGMDIQDTGADFGWTPEQTTEFYQWLDTNYGDAWRAWTGEEWNSFWTWFNNPESHAAQGTIPEDSAGGAAVENGTGGNLGLEGVLGVEEAGGMESGVMHSDNPEVGVLSIGADKPLSLGQDFAEEEPGSAADPDTPPTGQHNKLGGSLPWSDQDLSGSPRTVEIRSEGTPKSELSGLLNGELSLMSSEFAHLGGFLFQLSGLLKNLTPASDEIAKQQSEFQDQISLLLKSMDQKGVVAGVDGKLSESNGQNGEVGQLRDELDASRSELASIQAELHDKSQKLAELTASLDTSEEGQKKARDQDITHLREELESQYHERLALLQSEVESKDAEINRLKATRASSLGEGAGAGGGDLHELRMALDEMEITHGQQLAEINKELEIKSAENEDLKRELDEMDAMQDELDAKAEQINLLESKLAAPRSTPEGESSENYPKSQHYKEVCELREQLSEKTVELEGLRSVVSSGESSNSAVQSEVEKLRRERQALESEIGELRQQINVQSVGEISLTNPSAPQPETGKLMLAVGVAEMQIRALSKELEGKGVNVGAFVTEALGPYLEMK